MMLEIRKSLMPRDKVLSPSQQASSAEELTSNTVARELSAVVASQSFRPSSQMITLRKYNAEDVPADKAPQALMK